MRDDCLNCARKHLAMALVLDTESRLGYPQHRWLAIGNMCLAESELCIKWLDVAIEIREHRKAYEEDPDYILPLMDIIVRIGCLTNT